MKKKPGVVYHAYSPSTWEAEAGVGLKPAGLCVKRKEGRKEKGSPGEWLLPSTLTPSQEVMWIV